jgi:two-component system, OmpR family, phosphate regulon sensor histidine kinase PhoR
VQFRLRHVLGAAVLVGALLAGAVLVRVLDSALVHAGVTGEAAAGVRSAVLLTLVAVGVAAVVCGALLGRLLAASLARTRGRIVGHARGDAMRARPASRLREVADVEHAAERLAQRVAAREAEIERGNVEVSVLLDAISDGIIQLDSAGRVVRANPGARELLDLDLSVIGRPIATHVSSAELRPLLQRAAAGETVNAAEVTVGDRTLLVSGRPLAPAAADRSDTAATAGSDEIAPDGGSARVAGGAVVAFVDITPVRRLESVRRDFVANVSHELKTPLTSIRGYAETLLTDELPPEVQKQFVEIVYRNADRLHHIVEDLLDLSRLESGGWQPELGAVNALEIVHDAWSGCNDQAAGRNIRFVADSPPIHVSADAGGLRQVLTNLLDNALRYTTDGGRIEVRVLPPAASAHGSDTPARMVTFEVKDNGIGIPTDALPRIFERFYRVDPARSRAAGGTGLGLAIVRHLVESMGGDVGATSELGKGTTIRFRLPAADESAVTLQH